MISKYQADSLLEQKVQNINLRRHMMATEAVLRALAHKLGKDEELWGLTGLLHDLDLEAVDQDPMQHAEVAANWLTGKLPQVALQAIRAHNGENLNVKRESELDHALAAAENLTGLIVAATMVLPSKSLCDLKARSVRKRMKEPRFAAGANRDIINECSHLGLEIEEFIELGVMGMKSIAQKLGLDGHQ